MKGLIRKIFKNLKSAILKLPTPYSAKEIDREYIEGETAEEIAEISQMTDIPDKAQRHPIKRSKSKTRLAS